MRWIDLDLELDLGVSRIAGACVFSSGGDAVCANGCCGCKRIAMHDDDLVLGQLGGEITRPLSALTGALVCGARGDVCVRATVYARRKNIA